MTKLSDEAILHIYVEIAGGRGNHGGFLRSFAEAVMRADPMNFQLLRQSSMTLIEKYELQKYLSNFEGVRP